MMDQSLLSVVHISVVGKPYCLMWVRQLESVPTKPARLGEKNIPWPLGHHCIGRVARQ